MRQSAASRCFQQVEPGSALDAVLTLFRKFEIWHPVPDQLSVQKIISEGVPGGAKLLDKTRKAVRLLLFDHLFQAVCGLGDPDSDTTLEDARDRTQLIWDPQSVLRDRRSTFLERHWNRRFLLKMANSLRDAERRERALPMDVETFFLARHWVDDHCPLWMMTRPVLEHVLPTIATEGFWTRDIIRKRFRKLSNYGVTRFPKEPIVKVEFGGSGWKKIKAFTLSGPARPIDKSELDYGVIFRNSRKNVG